MEITSLEIFKIQLDNILRQPAQSETVLRGLVELDDLQLSLPTSVVF